MAVATKSVDSFIATKTDPTGPGGDSSVGFSLKKYRATLFALKDKVVTVKEQARQLKVSYGVLRKWRAEPKFKQLVEQHKDEFFAWHSGLVRDWTNATYFNRKIEEAMVLARKFLQREGIEKNWHLFTFGLEKRLSKARLNNAQLREYQMLCLDQALMILKDRKAARKYRQELVTLLQGLKETMK